MGSIYYAAILLLIPATAAPLHLREIRQVEQDSDGDNLLRQVYTGLELLYQLSVYELIGKINISSTDIGNEDYTNILFSALDITCDLYTANTDLIPSIENLTYSTSPSINILKKLGGAGEDKSCLWLRYVAQEVNNEGATVDCSELSEICKTWSSIKEYEEAKSNIVIYKSSINTTEQYIDSSFSSEDQITILNLLINY